MHELKVVASGTDWSVHQERGALRLSVTGQPFTVTPHRVTVALPSGFVREVSRKKRDLRSAEERLEEDSEAPPVAIAGRDYTVVIMRNRSGFPDEKERINAADLTDERLAYYGIHVEAEIALRALDRGAVPFRYLWEDWFDTMESPPVRRKAPMVRRSACWLVRAPS